MKDQNYYYDNPRQRRKACNAFSALFTVTLSSVLEVVVKSWCSLSTSALSARRIRPGSRVLSVSNKAFKYRDRHWEFEVFSLADAKTGIALIARVSLQNLWMNLSKNIYEYN